MAERRFLAGFSNFRNQRRQVLAGAASLSLFGGFSPGFAATHSESDLEFPEVTESSQQSVEKAKKWLLKAINKDGGTGIDIGTPSDVACSGVTGLAFMSCGNTVLAGKHQRQVKKLCEFLISRVDRMGSNGSLQKARSQIEGDLGPYATHFFATQCLGQMAGDYRHTKIVLKALRDLEKFISGGQLANGSWGDNAWAPMLATACGWIALRVANFAGISVSGSSQKAGNFLVKNMPTLGKAWASNQEWYHRLYATAAGLRVLYAMGLENKPKARQALTDILNLVKSNEMTFGRAGGEEYLTFGLMTDMLQQEGGPNWKLWYPRVRDQLIKYQNRDGSWTGHHCITSRTFSTACAMMVLTAPNRYLPISQA